MYRNRSHISFIPLSIVLATVSLVTVPLAVAQPVPSREPESTHVFPAGGQRGTTVAVRVGTQCFPPLSRWQIEGAGVTVTPELSQEVRARYEPAPRRDPTEVPVSHSREWSATVEIAADAAPGVRLWSVTSARGGSGRRPFVVGELPEIIETEPNSHPDRAEPVAVPSTINGQIAGERDLDYYRFSARAGQIVVCELAAARLGSPLDPLVEVRTAAGRRLPVDERSVGSDPIVTFVAPSTGEYSLLIANLGTYGGPEFVYRATLTTTEAATSIPIDGERGDVSRLAGERRGASPTEDATQISLPHDERGCLGSIGTEDWYRFDVAKDAAVSILCQPYPAGAPTLPRLELLDSQNKPLAQASSIEFAGRQARIEWRATSAGQVRLRVRDVQQATRGGPEFTYRLIVRVNQADFELTLATDHANILPGGKLTLDVAAIRSGGMNAAIELTAEDLPPGVSCQPVTIPGDKAKAALVLMAADDARPMSSRVRIVGRAKLADHAIERTATAAHQGADADGVSLESPIVPDLQLCVQYKPVFRLFCAEAYQYAHRGSLHPYLMEIERLDGFDGPVTLQIGDRQNRDLDGIEMIETTIPPGVNQAMMPIYMPENMHVNVQSQSQLYVQGHATFTDRWGQRQSLLVVSEKRNIIRTLPPVMKLKAVEPQVAAQPGRPTLCKLRLERTPNFTGPVRIELFDAPDGVTAQPATIAAGETSAVARVEIAGTALLPNATRLTFRARGQLPNETVVLSEATMSIVGQ